MKSKLFRVVAAFMLLFPFRLPFSVLLVITFNRIAKIAGSVVPDDVLAANVVITKLIYDIILGALFVYSIEMMSRDKLKRKPHSAGSDDETFWWTLVIIFFMIIYTAYDGFAAYQIFNSVK